MCSALFFNYADLGFHAVSYPVVAVVAVCSVLEIQVVGTNLVTAYLPRSHVIPGYIALNIIPSYIIKIAKITKKITDFSKNNIVLCKVDIANSGKTKRKTKTAMMSS